MPSAELLEIEKALRPLGQKKRKEIDEWYVKSQFKNLGIPVPVQRRVAKQGFSFSDRPHTEQRVIWNKIWKTATTHEGMSQALFYFGTYKKDLTPTDWRMLKTWINRIDNWAHSDYLSDLYSHALEQHPGLIYPTLKKWNRSTNPWKRRISIVSLIYYQTPKRTPPPVSKILPLVRPLLRDKDPYVQKAVGWTLRECGKIYPDETWTFLKTHIRDLAPVSFSYATEKLNKRQKEALKTLRKQV